MGLLRAVIVAIALSDLAPSLKTASRVSPTSDTATKRTRDRGRRTHPRRSLTACYRTRNRPSRCLAEPGYDVASGILYWPPKHFAVPAVSTEPAAGELDKARELEGNQAPPS